MSILLTILIYALIFALIWWMISILPIPTPPLPAWFRQVLYAILIIAAIIVLLGLVGIKI